MRRWSYAALVLLVAAGAAFFGLPSLQTFRAGRDVTVRRDLSYVEGSSHPKHALDLYLPPHPDPARPAILFVHGGWWRAGDRSYWSWVTGLYGNAGRALADLGYPVAVASYRLHPEVGLDAMLDDLGAAARFAQAQGRGLVLVGHSAGGHLVTSLATDAARRARFGLDVRAVVALSGLYELAVARTLVDEELRTEVFEPLFGSDPAWSPMRRFGPDMPRALFVVGSEDYPACRRNFDDARAALAGQGPTFVEIEGYTHEDVVLRLGARDDAVTPHIAALLAELRR